MPNQKRLWSDPSVVSERRGTAEAAMGRALELPEVEYSTAETAVAAAHLARVTSGATPLRLVGDKEAA